MLRLWVELFNKKHLVHKAFKLCTAFGFHLDDVSSHGPPKGVYQYC